MKTPSRTFLKAAYTAVALSLAAVHSPVNLLAESTTAEMPVTGVDLALKEGSKLWLEGDSTLHAFSAHAQVLAVEAQVKVSTGTAPMAGVAQGAVQALTVRVPVEQLKSEKKGLDENMYEALKSNDHPEITFLLESYTVQSADEPEQFSVEATGSLTIAGISKKVVLHGQFSITDQTLLIKGKKDLLMTDFGIKPPKMMMGTIRTKNEIVVHYDLTLTTK